MPLRRQLVVAVLALSCALSCGSKSKTFDVSIRRPEVGPNVQTSVNVVAAASRAIGQQRRDAFIWAAAGPKEQPESIAQEPSVPVAASLAQSDVWACIAQAETGSDYTMTGSVYSTAFGMINDIIYDYGSPEEQAAVFSGTASKETQIAIASRFANEHGFGGWGELTKQKCGL